MGVQFGAAASLAGLDLDLVGGCDEGEGRGGEHGLQDLLLYRREVGA